MFLIIRNAFRRPLNSTTGLLLGWVLIVAIGAVDFVAGCAFFVFEIDNIGMAVDARPHFVVFNEETTCGIVDLGPVRVARRCPLGICMAFEAGRIIGQILGKNRCTETEGQRRKENCMYC